MGLSEYADSIKQKIETIKKVFSGATSFATPGGFVKPEIEEQNKSQENNIITSKSQDGT